MESGPGMFNYKRKEKVGYHLLHPILSIGILKHTLRSVNDVTEGITKETPMRASWVIPRKVDKMV